MDNLGLMIGGHAAAEAGNDSLKDISRTAAREAERELILKMLQQTRWNRKKTAEILGISYKALLDKIKEGGRWSWSKRAASGKG